MPSSPRSRPAPAWRNRAGRSGALRAGRPRLVALALVALVAALAPWTLATAQSSGPTLVLSSRADVLRLGTRLVFSTGADLQRGPEVLTVRNTGGQDLVVTSLALTGPQAGSFVLDPSQAPTFSVAPGASAPVKVLFRPAPGVAEHYADLVLTTTDPARASVSVPLAGIWAAGFEGPAEPVLQSILRVLGYGTRTGSNQHFLSSLRTPAGDERISPWWVAADPTRATQLIPIARYSGLQPASACPCFRSGYLLAGKHDLFYYPGGSDRSGGTGNQRVLPRYVGHTSFQPGPDKTFVLYSNDGAETSDDGRNVDKKHDMRVYPAKDGQGNIIANHWIVVTDIGGAQVANHDYNDEVYLLVNARPALPMAPSVGSPSTQIDFSVSRPGTIADRAGNGTGFSGVQPSSNGGGYRPEQLGLVTMFGLLSVNSTAGTNSGPANNQDNALTVDFDASRRTFTVDGRLYGPVDHYNAGREQSGIFFGPDQDNFFKVEVENRDGVPHLTAYYEANSTRPFESLPNGRLVGAPVSLVGAGTGNVTLDLRVVGDPNLGTLTPWYRINNGAWVSFGDSVAPNSVSQWFSTQAHAGILTSHAEGAPFTQAYDSFGVSAG